MPTFVRTQEIEHEIGDSGDFALRVTSSDVDLEGVEGRIARVRVQFELQASSESEADELFERVKYQVREGPAFIEVAEPKRGDSGIGSIVRMLGIGGAHAEATVSAEVPATAAVSYDGVSADLTSSGFRGEQQYRTVSGDIFLDGLAGKVSVRGVSGDVSLRGDGPVSLELNTVSGDVSAFAPRIDAVRVVTVSGDVEIEGELAADGDHRVETVSGDLSLGVAGGTTIEVRGLSTDVSISLPHRTEGSRDRRRYVVGDGSATLLFSSMSGDAAARESRRFGAASVRPPTPPTPPTPPIPPTAPTPPTPPTPPLRPTMSPEEQLEILRALERGEIDVDEASARLAGRAPDG